MAKRANPYVEDFVPQRKVHMGLKQFNNNEVKLKDIYDKTLKLLFKGAKKSSAPDMNNTDVVFDKKDNMKQLFIGKDGTLSRSGHTPHSTRPTVDRCRCPCASRAQSESESSCAYCEAAVCESCQRACARCRLEYCERCCLVASEGSAVCVSCYS